MRNSGSTVRFQVCCLWAACEGGVNGSSHEFGGDVELEPGTHAGEEDGGIDGVAALKSGKIRTFVF